MTIKARMLLVALAAAFGISVFATGVWAGAGRSIDDSRPAVQARPSFWNYDSASGNPTGPAGQADFWNYDPRTGAKISDYSPGVAPEDLAALWSVPR
jgi:hypothetical protein